MNLDNRIKSLSDILTCFDIEQASQFLGQVFLKLLKFYFSDIIKIYD